MFGMGFPMRVDPLRLRVRHCDDKAEPASNSFPITVVYGAIPAECLGCDGRVVMDQFFRADEGREAAVALNLHWVALPNIRNVLKIVIIAYYIAIIVPPNAARQSQWSKRAWL
jgi:hypothetical protein